MIHQIMLVLGVMVRWVNTRIKSNSINRVIRNII